MTRLAIGLVALLTTFAGCRPGGDVSTEPVVPDIPSSAERLPVQPVDPLATILRFQSGIEERERMVVRTDAEWRAVWTRLTSFLAPTPPVPAVDFTKDMIVLAAMGTRPSGGFGIHIREAAQDANAVYVVVEERSPGDDCVTIAVMTAPVAAVRVPRSDRPVRWIERTTVEPCL